MPLTQRAPQQATGASHETITPSHPCAGGPRQAGVKTGTGGLPSRPHGLDGGILWTSGTRDGQRLLHVCTCTRTPARARLPRAEGQTGPALGRAGAGFLFSSCSRGDSQGSGLRRVHPHQRAGSSRDGERGIPWDGAGAGDVMQAAGRGQLRGSRGPGGTEHRGDRSDTGPHSRVHIGEQLQLAREDLREQHPDEREAQGLEPRLQVLWGTRQRER